MTVLSACKVRHRTAARRRQPAAAAVRPKLGSPAVGGAVLAVREGALDAILALRPWPVYSFICCCKHERRSDEALFAFGGRTHLWLLLASCRMVYDGGPTARGLSPHVAQQAMAALAAIAGRRASIALDAGRAARAYAAASADAAALAVDTLATFYNERVGFYNEAVATRASARAREERRGPKN